MRAVVITKHGAPSVLQVRDLPEPEPKENEVRIRVEAAGLNFAEIMARQGLYPDAPKPPCVVGYEVSGVVDRLGSGASRFKIGERVAGMTRFNGHAELVCAAESQCFALPSAMSFEEAAAIPVNYLTAYHMLFQIYRVRAGDHVLIHMAAGGVGTAALQLCRSVKGVVTYGTASGSKHDYVRQHGCQHPIDYRKSDYAAEIKKLTAGRGVDLILDALGGNDWRKGYKLLRASGMLIAFGWANMNSGGKRNLLHVIGEALKLPRYTPLEIMNDNRAIAGCNMGHMWNEGEMLRSETEAIVQLYNQGVVKPHVDCVFPFAQAAQAHAQLEQGKNVGKVLLRPN